MEEAKRVEASAALIFKALIFIGREKQTSLSAASASASAGGKCNLYSFDLIINYIHVTLAKFAREKSPITMPGGSVGEKGRSRVIA